MRLRVTPQVPGLWGRTAALISLLDRVFGALRSDVGCRSLSPGATHLKKLGLPPLAGFFPLSYFSGVFGLQTLKGGGAESSACVSQPADPSSDTTGLVWIHYLSC